MFDFSTFPQLATPRLLLRQLVVADAADVLLFRGDAEVQKYNSEPLKDVAEAAAFIEQMQQGYSEQREILWAITLRQENRVLGSCSLHQWDRYHRRAEIGYDLARSQWGQGIASEAVQAILHFAFAELQLNRIEAYTIIDNFASVRMLEKLGFQLEGVRRQYSWEEDGLFHGSGMFSLLQSEYLDAQSNAG